MTNKETMSSWGWRIKKANFSQVKFCEKYDISRPYLNKAIKGKANLTTGYFDRIEFILSELGV